MTRPVRRGGVRAVLDGLRDLATCGEAGVLAVVVETFGSTYRKPGALVLLDQRGVRAGALSGGCLEDELETAARSVLHTRRAAEVRFDTNGDTDRVFGSGTGCGGCTRVHLLPVPAAASPLREALFAADARGATLELRLAPSSAQPGAGEARVDGACWRFAPHGGDDGKDTPDAVHDDDNPLRLSLHPAPRLLLLGAGPETGALVQLANLLGWHVVLAEHRQRWTRFAESGGVDALHRDGPDGWATHLAATPFDAALVMHHNYLLDARALALLADTPVAHVGLLGPATRRDELLADIGADVAGRLRPRLHAPVGLPLGGEGAEAIALSIAAELQRRFSALA